MLQEDPDFLAAVYNLIGLDHVEIHGTVATEFVEHDVFGEINVRVLIFPVVKRNRFQLGHIECHVLLLKF